MDTPRKKVTLAPIIAMTCLIALLGVFVFVQTAGAVKRSYKFVTVSHPVDMWADGADKWAYYFVNFDPSSKLADTARKELIPQGFTEDHPAKTIFRFTKGEEQVIVCRHGDFSVNFGSKLELDPSSKRPGTGSDPADNGCVLVKNGPGTDTNITAFKIKALVLRW